MRLKKYSFLENISSILIIKEIYRYKDLIIQFVKRETEIKYKNSYLGLLWAIINPLILLCVYTFVFGVVFKAKWNINTSQNIGEFAITLFAGLLVYNIFSESVNRAPSLIISNPNYVKKVVFPLEILSVSVMGSILINFTISLLVLIIAVIIFTKTLSWTIILLPLILLPLIMLSLGISWFLSSLGVFIRDIGYVTNIIVMILMYTTPIFYPISAVPNKFQNLMKFNPLSVVVESVRSAIIFGKLPDFLWLGIVYVVSYIIMQLGYRWFIKTKSLFADVM